jgi:hypothetical protein
VIVVDDHSQDATGEAARRHPGTKVVRTDAVRPLPGPARLTRPWRALPRSSVRGIERLRARGVSPGPLTRAALVVCQYLFVQLPTSVGEVVGLLRRSPDAS